MINETSPRATARIAGALLLLTIVLGTLAQFVVAAKLIAYGNATATAANILEHRSMFEAGFAIYLIEMACQVAMTAFFYELLKPAGRNLSLVVAFLSLAGCVIKAFARVFYIAPLFVLGGAAWLSSFRPEQLRELALLLIRLNDQGAGVALAFFGFATFLKGFLVLRSTFLPRFLGVLSLLNGLAWMSFAYPSFGFRMFAPAALLGLIGSAVWIFWLLVFGVDEERWREQALSAS